MLEQARRPKDEEPVAIGCKQKPRHKAGAWMSCPGEVSVSIQVELPQPGNIIRIDASLTLKEGFDATVVSLDPA